MSLYLEFKVKTIETDIITGISYHQQLGLLAILSSNQNDEAQILICDELGEDLHYSGPNVCKGQITSFCWHPTQRTLAIGSNDREICIWNGGLVTALDSVHEGSIIFAKWSSLGGCLVTGDQTGIVVGWKSDSRGLLKMVFKSKVGAILSKEISFRAGRAATDISNLAKMAVAGDQSALDIFSSWRPRTTSHGPRLVTTDNTTFYCASVTGELYYFDEDGEFNVVFTSKSTILRILCHESKDICIVVCKDLTVAYYKCHKNGSITEVSKVKLNGIKEDVCIIWSGPSLLACTTNDLSIRFWDIESGNSYVLTAPISFSSSFPKQTFLNISYLKEKVLLCASTNLGNIIIWRFDEETEDQWNIQGLCKIQDSIKHCVWGPLNLAIHAINGIYILREHALLASYKEEMAVVQSSANNLNIFHCSSDEILSFNTDFQVIGLALTKEHICLWSGKLIAVYTIITKELPTLVGNFNCDVQEACIYDRVVIVAENSGKLQIRTFQGTIKQTLDIEAPSVCLCLSNCYLAVVTLSGVIHIWDLNRREAKSMCKPKDITLNIDDFSEVIQLRLNSNGTKVSFTAANLNLVPMARLYVWDRDLDKIYVKHFEKGLDVDETRYNDTRFIVSHYWDTNEPNLLFCEAKCIDKPEKKLLKPSLYNTFAFKQKKNKSIGSSVILSIFFIEQKGLQIQDILHCPDQFCAILGLDAPYYIILCKRNTNTKMRVERLLMKEFEGIENCDSDIRAAIVNFGYNLCLGDLDLAFNFISNIKSTAVWTSLAKMCVKTKRLDVAEICLGHMKDCRGLTILRSVIKEQELDAKVACLAVHLGMYDEAEELYKSCNRYDLLNKFYRARNQITASLDVAETKDRIHLRNTYYNVGRNLENKGDVAGAANMYCKSETHGFSIPKMLLDDPITLENYVVKNKNLVLLKWWAQYLEGSGDMDGAIKYYQQANDDLSTVRILCYLGNLEQAARICMNTTDKAACCHLARAYEMQGLYEEAVKMYVDATAYVNAIRLCKEQFFDNHLWNIALLSDTKEKLSVAQYFEQISPDKAVVLYHQAGYLHKAIDLAFRCQNYDAIVTMSQELNIEDDSSLLLKCSSFFMNQGHYDNAVNLLAMANKFEEAVDQCQEHKVTITDTLGDHLTPPSNHPKRTLILEKLAECALMQANYHIAAKKFTQAGQKVKAMKALLKSGDTEKIIFYANVSRQHEIYIMAANYLQTLDWQERPDFLKTIVSFYNKGKAPHLLANFYISCAQLEVDEYRNYSKAIGALSEALKVLSKDSDQYKTFMEDIAKKITLIKKFLDIKRQIDNGVGDSAMTLCRQILSSPNMDILRYGDVYSIMVEYYTALGDNKSAIQLVNELVTRTQQKDNLLFYIDKDILKKLGFENEYIKENSIDEDEDEIPEV
ncbi:Six-bladed beta-propeller, TolB-like,WD40-repeat-containing domain,WD40 repeat, conserved site,WD40/YVTN [Cinara cedri]|uniref:Six-bladed beta-propeller, TolB-like,WD40-repeat-containing domain,WD40 repeat, conserved site,WD40/YVTN n=1 Tax=Cinara cedri TaxID=506608 RepID=A0A5E4MD66_9HEMI|nr:Six-bladed beta-propeller, TolB-like,WD40-repeat-containing domain,WD40 repeat, conserved site,WD40/YVTN [Cinara cedri]